MRNDGTGAPARWPVVALVCLVTLSPAGARAQAPAVHGVDADAGDADGTGWAIEVLPYAWIPGNFGTITAHGRTSHVDVTVKDALDLATGGDAFTAAGYFELRHDRAFAYVDGFGGYVDERVTETVPSRRFPQLAAGVDAKLKLKPVLVDFGLGYRVGQWVLPNRRRPMTLGLLVGTRYYWFHQRVRATAAISGGPPGLSRAADVSATIDWADPVIGVRWEVPVLDQVSVEFRGDVGGFGAGSDLAWNLVAGTRWWPDFQVFSGRPFVAAGYRALGFDYPAGGAGGADLQFRGPWGGLGMAF